MNSRLLYQLFGLDEFATYILLFFVAVAILAINYFFIRWVFDIKKQLWNQKQQINLLIKIAEKLGVDRYNDGLDEIQRKNNSND